MKKINKFFIVGILMVFITVFIEINSCSKSPMAPEIKYQSVEVFVGSPNISCQKAVIWLDNDYVRLYKEIVSYEDSTVQVRQPAIAIFNNLGDIKIGFGDYRVDGKNSDVIPFLSYIPGSAQVELDSTINSGETLYGTSIDYWKNDRNDATARVRRLVDRFLDGLKRGINKNVSGFIEL